ncbi:hypothetical protein ACFPRL_20110 [Pseudoclavibacter helvolus]
MREHAVVELGRCVVVDKGAHSLSGADAVSISAPDDGIEQSS